MAGFSCAACGAEFETRERLEEHKRKEHSGVQQDAGSTHTQSGQPEQPSNPRDRTDQ
jgi:hypothetical protein